MKADRYVWVALSVLFCLLGTHLLLDSIHEAGPYADEYVFLRATFTALGLATLLVAFQQYLEARAMSRHMRRGLHLTSRSRGSRT